MIRKPYIHLAIALCICCQPLSECAAQPGPFDYVHADKEPEPLNLTEIGAKIPYPIAALKAGIEGAVYFRILVNERGKYCAHIPLNNSPAALAEAAAPYLTQLAFSPGKVAGKALPYCWVNVKLSFDREQPRRKSATQVLDSDFVSCVRNPKKARREYTEGLTHLHSGDYARACAHFGWSLAYDRDRKAKSAAFRRRCYQAVSLSRLGKGADAVVAINHCWHARPLHEDTLFASGRLLAERAIARLAANGSISECAIDLELAGRYPFPAAAFADWAAVPYHSLPAELLLHLGALAPATEMQTPFCFFLSVLFAQAGLTREGAAWLRAAPIDHVWFPEALSAWTNSALAYGDFEMALTLTAEFGRLEAGADCHIRTRNALLHSENH